MLTDKGFILIAFYYLFGIWKYFKEAHREKNVFLSWSYFCPGNKFLSWSSSLMCLVWALVHFKG